MENGNYLQGMPCHKYIFRNLKNHAEAVAFQRAFVDTLTANKVSDPDIAMALSLLDVNLGQNENLSGYSFAKWDSNHLFGDDVLSNIRFDNSVPTYRCCTQLYKKYDEKRPCCMLCSLSPKYANALGVEEQALIRFAFASEENYLFLLDEGLTKDHFVYNIDLMESMTTQKPCPFPVYRSAFLSLYDPASRAEYYSGGCESLTMQMQSFLVQCIRLAKPPKTYLTADWTVRFCRILADMIYAGEPCTKEKAVRHIASLKNRVKNANRTVIGPKSNLTADSLSKPKGTVSQEQVEAAVATDEVKTSDLDSVYDSGINTGLFNSFSSKDLSAEDMKNFVDDSTYYINEDVSIDMDALMDMLLARGKNRATAGEVQLTEGLGIDVENFLSVISSSTLPARTEADNGYAPYDDWEYYTGDEETIDIESRVVCGNELPLITIPVIESCEYEKVAVSLDDGNAKDRAIFESGVLKCKQLCVEVVKNEKGLPGFIMWVPQLRNYFYSFVCYKEVLTDIFSYAKIEKVCFQPYILYSFLAEKNMVLKNVYSILGAYSFLYTGISGETYESVMGVLRANEAIGGVTYPGKYQCESSYLLYLPSYSYIKRSQYRDLEKHGRLLPFEESCYFDEAVGISYSRSYLPDAAPLFEMEKPGAFKFIPYEGVKSYIEGSFITYRLTPGKSNTPCSKVLFNVLGKLAESGRMRKHSIWVAWFGENSVTLFIEKKSLAYMTTIINVTFLSYVEDTGDKSIEVSEIRTVAEIG